MAYSYETGKKMVRFTENQIMDYILENYSGKKIVVLAPLVRGRKGHYRELFENSPAGLFRTGLDGRIMEVNPVLAAILAGEFRRLRRRRAWVGSPPMDTIFHDVPLLKPVTTTPRPVFLVGSTAVFPAPPKAMKVVWRNCCRAPAARC